MKYILVNHDDIYLGKLILINLEHSIVKPLNCNELQAYSSDYSHLLLTSETRNQLHSLFNELGCGDDLIVPVSGYRSLEEQIDIYSTSMHDSGEEFTNKYVAKPNCSEHQSGLAIDLGIADEKIDFLCPKFPNEGIALSFRSLAPNYGFIERYQKGKEDITLIAAEEWHFRYVGYPHSAVMTEKHLCLEEYLQLLEKHIYQENPLVYKGYEISYVPMKQDEMYLTLEDNDEISGNNYSGFIITRKIV